MDGGETVNYSEKSVKTNNKSYGSVTVDEGDTEDRSETVNNSVEEVATENDKLTPELKMPDPENRGEKEKWYGNVPSIKIPFIEDYEFSTWVKCVEAWSKTSSIPLLEQGFHLAESIPISSKKYGSSLREDIYKTHEPDKLIDDPEGVTKVVTFLQGRIYIDQEEEIYSTHRKFKFLQRKKGQSIVEYVTEFDTTLQKIFQLKILPSNDKRLDRMFALELMLTADLNDYEYALIRSVAAIKTEDGNRFNTVKSKMREILGKLNEKVRTSNNEIMMAQQNSKREDDIPNSSDEVYLANGWKPPSGMPTKKFQHKNYDNRNRNHRSKYSGKKEYGASNYNKNNSHKKTYMRNKAQNPLGQDGKPMKCLSCQAITHLIKDCPDAYENNKFKQNKKYQTVWMVNDQTQQEEKVLIELSETDSDQESEEDVYCSVFCTDETDELSRFTSETLNMAALDTCCSSSVSGEKWLKIYLDNLPKTMKREVVGPLHSNKKFMFGNQGRLEAKAKYIIPTKIGGENNKIELDVIESDIPLLLSKDAMKDLGITLDMKNDRGTINGKPLILTTTSAGHYTIDLLNNKEELKEVCIAELEENNDKNQTKALLKIHKQFGHRPKNQFVTILKEAGQWQEKFSDMIDKIMDSCEGCIMRKRSPDRPAVAPPLSSDFGQVLCIDLKIWDHNKGIYILYMIDHFTRYQVAAIVKSKEPEAIVNAITLKWLPVFGRVDSILSDNGGEFCNEEMREVSSLLNIELKTTGANSPWQNGTVERNHMVTDTIIHAVQRDYPKMRLEIALAWAVTAVNSMSSVRGFSPHQLVFGRQIKLPSILDDPPPAWEEPKKSKSLLEFLEGLHKTREEYTKAERCERIKRALRAKIRVCDTIYEKGDIVYFKKEGEEAWRGPAKVVFQDNKVIFIRIGSIYYRVSANRLIKAGEGLAANIKKQEEEEAAHSEKDETTPKEQTTIQTRNQCAQAAEEDTPDWTNLKMINTRQSNTEQIDDNIIEDNTNVPTADIPTADIPTTDIPTTDYEQQEVTDNQTNKRKGHKRKKVNQKPTPELNEDGTISNAARVLKRNDRIEILENGKWEKGTVLSHGGKVTGKYQGWYNFQLDNGQIFNGEAAERQIRYEANSNDEVSDYEEVAFIIKLDNGKTIKVDNIHERKIWMEKEEESTAILLLTEETLAVMVPKEKRDSPEALVAKIEELKKLEVFNTYKIVEDEGQERITTTWVLTEKGKEIRARLTVRGFQEEGSFPTDSPTVQKHTIKILLSIAATEGWDIKTTDISSAFLQGDKMDRLVFVKPPKESQLKNKLWLLEKCLYGLKDASRKWYFRVLNKLKELGFKTSHYDAGFFYLIKDGILIGIVALHVDDFLFAGSKYFNQAIITKLLSCFKVGKSETRDFLYTGFRMKQTEEGVTIDQEKYVKNVVIPTVDVQQLKDRKRDMNQDELTLLRQITGIVNWAARATRPDLSFEMIDLSTKFKGGQVEDLIKAKNVAARLKKIEMSIMVSNLDNLQDCQVVVYTDAAFRNLNNNTDSCGGFVVFLVNIKNGKCAPIEWKSGKLKRKVHSTLGAETQALNNGLDAALGAKLLLKEITNGKVDLEVTAITDNKSCRDAVYSESEVTERILRGDIAIIKEMISTNRVKEIKWVVGEMMLADLLTKRGVNKIPLMDVLQTGRFSKENLKDVTG